MSEPTPQQHSLFQAKALATVLERAGLGPVSIAPALGAVGARVAFAGGVGVECLVSPTQAARFRVCEAGKPDLDVATIPQVVKIAADRLA